MPPIENGAVLSSLPKERNLWYLWLSLNFRLSGMWYVMCVCVCARVWRAFVSMYICMCMECMCGIYGCFEVIVSKSQQEIMCQHFTCG